MRRWRTITALLLILVLASVTACNPFAGDEEETSQQLVEVVLGDLIVSVSGSGNIAVADEARLTFGSGGKIDKIYVDEGDEVSKGDILARLDTDYLELALTQAQVALTGQELAVSQAEVNVKNAEIALEKAEDSWLDTESAGNKVKRLKKYLEWVLENDPEDTEEIKAIQASLQVAWARFLIVASNSVDAREVTVKEREIELAEQSVEQMKHSLQQFQQALEQAQKDLSEATITAPLDGMVVTVDADEGDSVSAAMTIVHLIDLTSMELSAEVDEIDVADVKSGQRAVIEVDALPALQLEGKVISISLLPETQAGIVVYKVKIGLDVPPDSELKVGMSATVDIIIDERTNVLLVPNRAIRRDSQGNQVVKVKVDEEVEERKVTTGISDGLRAEIVSGLEEGEIVVER
jgi:HlyD family secretion protein